MTARTRPATPAFIDELLARYTAWAIRRAKLVVAFALVLTCAGWALASRLKIHGDFVSLLPTESGAAQRFSRALARKGGAASTLVVVIESPDANANQRFIDALATKLRALPTGLVASVQTGSQAERAYFHDNRWLFASERELMLVSCELDHENARATGGFELEDDCETEVDDELRARGVDPASQPTSTALAVTSSAPEAEHRSPLARIRATLEAKAAEQDRFKTGYFASDDGTRYALVVRSPNAGMGEFGSDELLRRVTGSVNELAPQRFQARAEVGFAGDIPNAVAERKSLIEDMTLVSALAIVLILGVILGYFRSLLALVHIGLAVALGGGIAFGVAALVVGHLNIATSFLGSIILGNGINTPIIYLARFRERRAAGDDVENALRAAALDCRRGTWLGALAAGAAYSALGVTSFRGFSEFGLIGGVGMLACWFAAFGFCPASIALISSWQTPQQSARPTAFDPFLARPLARFVAFAAPFILLAAGAWALAFAHPVTRYLTNPWEYDFSKLRSASSSRAGAGHWSQKADDIFQTRGSPELLLATSAADALHVAAEVERRDREQFGGTLVEKVTTAYDYLGGPPEVVTRKLALLAQIRERIDHSLKHLRGDDRAFAEDWRPPETLHALGADDLPPLLRERFSEKDGRFGTAVYVDIDRHLSRSKGEHLLRIADLLEGVIGGDGEPVPSASRATVFAEMIRSMTRDAPRAVLVAGIAVAIASVLATHAAIPLAAVLGSLLLGVWATVGIAAVFDVRLNFLNFVAIPLTFGIGVEYAINLYDRIRALGGDVTAGISSAAGAVAACSLTTMLGYGSLLVGDNLALRSFGKYAVFGEVACLVTALFVMPSGLLLWQRFRAKRRLEAHAQLLKSSRALPAAESHAATDSSPKPRK